MSRCFPFPPPGYEKKARPDDDANILKKEKHKEKKHKKDKKEREKKEKKEKRDKEKGGEKNGEKKERKQKHKDKDKEEKKNSDVHKTVGSSSHRNDDKHAAIGIQVDQTHQGGILLELEKGFGKWNGPKEIQGLDRSNFKELSVKSSGKDLGSNHGIFVEENQKFKHIREDNKLPNVQSLKVVGKHLENGSLGKFLSKEQRIVGETVRQDEKVSEKQKERKDKSRHKSRDGKGDKHKDGDRERKSKSKDKKEKKEKKMEVKVNEVSTPVRTKLIENGNSSVNIQNDRGSYPFKVSSSDNGCLGKRKEPEMNGFVHGSGSPINKLPRPLSSSKVKQNGIRDDATNPEIRFVMESEAAEHKLDGRASCSSSIPENGTKLDTRQTANNHAPERREAMINNHHKALESLSTPQMSLLIGRKLEPSQSAMDFARKEQGVVTDFKVNKKVLSVQPIAENGRNLESSQPCTFPSAEKKGAISKPKFDDQEIRINGLGLRKPDACSKRPPVATEQLKEIVESNLKPPHPDAKYLTEILTVPKVEWSDIDDLSWLFASEDQGGNKRRRVPTELEEPKEVWAEALQLESADITALPYVIPY